MFNDDFYCWDAHAMVAVQEREFTPARVNEATIDGKIKLEETDG